MKKLLALSLSLLMILGTTSIAMAEAGEGEGEEGDISGLLLTLPRDAVEDGNGNPLFEGVTFNFTVRDAKGTTLSGTDFFLNFETTGQESFFMGHFSEDPMDPEFPYGFKEGDIVTIHTTEPAGYSGTATFHREEVLDGEYFRIDLTETATQTPGGGGMAEVIDYAYTSGAKQTWDCGSTTGPSFTVKTANQVFHGVGVDEGGLIPTDCYTRNKETNTITLKPEYLRTLKNGEHSIRIRFGDGEAATTFTLTGDCGSTAPVKGEEAYEPEVKPGVKPSPDTGR